ncbi:MAG TPA: leucyl aminopeptidase [Polyangiaceae bacterium]|nr:leucyl aminopeptidase [Polyangiaceae bacterium]
MTVKFTLRATDPIKESADVLALFVWSLEGTKRKGKSTLDAVDKALGGALGKLIKKDEFKGKRDQVLSVPTLGKLKADRVIVYGLGDPEKMTDGDLRTLGAKVGRAVNADKAKRLVVALPDGLEARARFVVEGIELGAYRFSKYLTGDRKPKAELGHVTLAVEGKVTASMKDSVALGQHVAEGVNIARDLSNEPPNVIYPDSLAEFAEKMAKGSGLAIKVFDYKEIVRRGMRLLQAVGQGSERKPCLVHMSWTPAKPKKRIVFVGKGVTFDSGGLSIKPGAGMGEMKHDMSGAANVVGLMHIIAALKPDVEVHGIIAAAENMPDGGAYRPGDIFASLDGKSVEIVNTDAEGRLILADAMAYARELEPDLFVDNATLTGACVVALGNTCSGWYAATEEAATAFQAAVKVSGENMWRMPLLEELRDQLKSEVADLKHTGDRWGGSISAALFLREFIGNAKNWVHCDIAGPAMADRSFAWNPKGGTGHGVLTFVELVLAAG